MPDWWHDLRGNSHGTLQSASGIWAIRRYDQGFAGVIWNVDLDFPNRYRSFVHLRHQKPPYLIQVTIGDPDSGNFMVFERAPQAK